MGKTKKPKKAATTAEKAVSKVGALERAIAQIEKQYGVGSIMQLGQARLTQVEGISTGAISLDIALGGQRHSEGQGYGTLRAGVLRQDDACASRYRQCPKGRGSCRVYRRGARSRDHLGKGNSGVDVNSMLVSQPDTGEQGLDITEMLIKIKTQLISSSSTQLPRSYRLPRYGARWGQPMSACRPDL